MGTISLSVPQTGQPNSTEDPKIATDFTTLQTWANGNIDGSNVAATLTGRRHIITGYFSGPGATSLCFTSGPGDLVPSGTNQGNRGIVWAYLDPANFAVTGKSNTQLVLRMSLATMATAPAVNFTAALYPVTFGGSTSGNIVPTAGSVVAGSSVTINTPAGSSAVVAETSPFTFPSAGAYAPTLIASGANASGSMTIMAVQLFVLNS